MTAPLLRSASAFFVLALAAQAAPAGDVWPAVFRDVAEVRVLDVEVFVADADGRPVRGLRRGDFELYENGERVEISNFFAVEDGRVTADPEAGADAGAAVPDRPSGGEPPAADESGSPRPIQLLLFVDEANLAPAHRKHVFDRLREFLLARWRPEMRVAVLTNDHALVLRQGFTAAPHDVFVTLDEIQRSAPPSARFDLDFARLIEAIEDVDVEGGSGLFSTKDPLAPGPVGDLRNEDVTPQETVTASVASHARSLLPQIDAYSQARFLQVRETLATLGQLVDTAAGLPGRKAVVYVGGGLSMSPGEALYEAFSRRFAVLDDVGSTLSPQAEAARDDALADFRDLTARANGSQVTLYTIDAEPPGALDRGSAAAVRSAGGNFGSYRDSIATTEERNRQEPLRLMAEETGGRTALSRSALDGLLDGLIDDFADYYSLGYRPSEDREAEGGDPKSERTIEVRVAREGLRVRHRRHLRDRDPGERLAMNALSGLVLGAGHNPLGIAAGLGDPVSDGGEGRVVPLLVEVPLANLVLLPGTDEHQGRVSLAVAARDARGRTSDVVRHLCPVRIPNPEVLVALGRTMVCGVRLRMRPGPQTISVAVRDEIAGVDAVVAFDATVAAQVAAP